MKLLHVLTVVGPEQKRLVKMSQLAVISHSIELLLTKMLIAKLEILLMLADINRIHF